MFEKTERELGVATTAANMVASTRSGVVGASTTISVGTVAVSELEQWGVSGPKRIPVGDAVLIRRTIYSTRRDRQPGIFNGQRGIVTGIDPANRDMSIEWKDASGELLRRTLSAEYVAASVGSGYALTNHGAQGQSIRHVHADPAGVGRNAAYVQATAVWSGSISTPI